MLTPLAGQLAQDSRLLNCVARHHFMKLKGRESYIRYLLATYRYVLASVPLLEFALATPFAHEDPEFRSYLEHHREEEIGHDRWILRDLALLGVSEDDVQRRHAPPESFRMPGAAYYSIAHIHPTSILGYMYALESAPLTARALHSLSKRCDVPRLALFTLEEHGKRDLEHRRELASVLDRYGSQPPLSTAIRNMAHLTLASLVALLKAVKENSPQ